MTRRPILTTPARRLVGIAIAGGWLAACDAPAAPALCQVPGELGAGAFTVQDCRHQEGCLDGWRFAAGSVETMIFCAAGGEEVTEVVSSDPRVSIAAPPAVLSPGVVAFDLAAGAPGPATIEVRGPDLVERLALTVEELGAIDITEPERIVEGGTAAITSEKRGVSGAPLFGRGGYDVTVPAGLSARPATTSTRDCELLQPDVVVTGDAVGSYRIATGALAPAWTATVDVVPAAAVAYARFASTRITGSPAAGYGAYVRVIGHDAGDRPLLGVDCTWQSPRPVLIVRDVCWSLVLLSTDEPLDLTCTFAGRELGTVHLSRALVL